MLLLLPLQRRAGRFRWILLLDGFQRISVLYSILTLDKTILKHHVQNIVGISYFCVRLYVQSYVYMVGIAFSVRVSRAHAVLPEYGVVVSKRDAALVTETVGVAVATQRVSSTRREYRLQAASAYAVGGCR